MNVIGKAKDNEKARLDLSVYCKRPKMHLQYYYLFVGVLPI